MTPDFLLVIPAFRESARLPPYLDELTLALERQRLAVQIQIVDDGSGSTEQDALLRALGPIRQSHSNVLEPICLKRNSGKGGAIMTGWSIASSARFLAFLDADGAIPSEEVVRLFKNALRNDDPRRCYFASRIRMLGRTVERKLARHLSGRVFASLVGRFIHPGIYDSQCGFKIITRQAFEAVQPLITEKRFAYDVELLVALIDTGFPVEEVPIDWRDVAGGKVSLLCDTINMAWQVWRIRKRRKSWQAGLIRTKASSRSIGSGSESQPFVSEVPTPSDRSARKLATAKEP